MFLHGSEVEMLLESKRKCDLIFNLSQTFILLCTILGNKVYLEPFLSQLLVINCKCVPPDCLLWIVGASELTIMKLDIYGTLQCIAMVGFCSPLLRKKLGRTEI